MKNYIILIVFVCMSSMLFISCEEEVLSAPVFDTNPPGSITDIVLTPVGGGFDIKFVAPSDTDLLYIKASYKTSGVGETELRVSKYANVFEVRGYLTDEEKTISFISVDKSGNESNVVEVVGIPLRAPILDVGDSMAIKTSFGGVEYTWENNLESNLIIQLLVQNEFGKFEINETLYNSFLEGIHNIRNLPPLPKKFAAVITDQYENVLDTIYPNTPDKVLTPILESVVDKDNFSLYALANDEIWTTSNAAVTELWDNVTNVSGNYARASLFQPKTYLTINLGVDVKLTRFKLHQRRSRYFTDGAPKTYTIYGTYATPSIDGDMSGWTKLADCEAVSPTGTIYSGADGQVIGPEDLEWALNGDEFRLSTPTNLVNAPVVRFIRIQFHTNWNPSGFIIFSELSFWGEIQ
jgi:hypothetical protein